MDKFKFVSTVSTMDSLFESAPISSASLETSALLRLFEINTFSPKRDAVDWKIDNLPFYSDEGLAPQRQKRLLDVAGLIMSEHISAEPGESIGVYSFSSFGKTLTAIENMQSASDREKAFIWDTIMSQRDETYQMGLEGVNQSLGFTQRAWDLSHAFPRFGFHSYYYSKLACLEPMLASKQILIHAINDVAKKCSSCASKNENSACSDLSGLNLGDILASEAQVAAFRSFKERGFSGYVATWRAKFLAN